MEVLQTEVGGIVDVVLCQAIHTPGDEVALRIDRSAIDRHIAEIPGCGSRLRDAIVVEGCLSHRYDHAADTAGKGKAQAQSLVGELVGPAEVVTREHTAELDHLVVLEVGDTQGAILIDQHPALSITRKVLCGVDVTE